MTPLYGGTTTDVQEQGSMTSHHPPDTGPARQMQSRLAAVERLDQPLAQPTDSGLEAYRGAVRRQWRLVALVTLASFLAALAWTVVRSPTYEATSTLLASPLP